MKLFGTDGIRGVAGKYPLDSATIRTIAIAAADILKNNGKDPAVLIGRDTRESGKNIAGILKRGLAHAGITTWDAGIIPTPGIAYLVKKYPLLAGIVISASHNPYQDNGIKFFSHKGTKLSDRVEAQIEKSIHAGHHRPSAGVSKRKTPPAAGLVEEYRKFLAGSLPKGATLKGMRLVIDCANGATCTVAEKVLTRLGAAVVTLNAKPDGKNINRKCGSLHPEVLARAVVKNRASCGLAFDGDGDRIVFTDEKGVVRDGDYFLAIVSRHLKKKKQLKNNTLVTTVMANLGLFRSMESEDIRVLKTAVGDRYVYQAMVSSGAVVGGEQSGHIIFRNLLQTGDGILSALQMLAVLSETGRSLSELSGVLRKYPQVLINTMVARKVPLENLPQAAKAVHAAEKKLGNNGRVLVRYSGTENLLRVMIEGEDKDEISAMAHDISDTALQEIAHKG